MKVSRFARPTAFLRRSTSLGFSQAEASFAGGLRGGEERQLQQPKEEGGGMQGRDGTNRGKKKIGSRGGSTELKIKREDQYLSD